MVTDEEEADKCPCDDDDEMSTEPSKIKFQRDELNEINLALEKAHDMIERMQEQCDAQWQDLAKIEDARARVNFKFFMTKNFATEGTTRDATAPQLLNPSHTISVFAKVPAAVKALAPYGPKRLEGEYRPKDPTPANVPYMFDPDYLEFGAMFFKLHPLVGDRSIKTQIITTETVDGEENCMLVMEDFAFRVMIAYRNEGE
jgi:hypothetical protein